MKRLVVLTLGLAMWVAIPTRLFASMPVHAVITGCVQDGVFMSESTDFGTHFSPGGYRITLRTEAGGSVDLTALEGRRIIMTGELLPGDTFFVEDETLLDQGLCDAAKAGGEPAGDWMPGDALPQGEASDSTAAPEVFFNNGNIGGVQNGPTRPTVFTLNEARLLALIENYHWNNGQGATPGNIALRDADGKTYGPWQTDGMEGMGGVPNAAWTVWPMIVLPAGTYTVIDSDPASWAQNEESEGRGFSRVETMPASTGIR